MSDRLKRKDIKQRDGFQLAVTTALEYVQTYRKQLIAGVVLLAVAGLAVVGWALWSASREDRAQAVLAEAIEAYGAPVGEDAADQADTDGPTFATEEERRARATELFQQVVDDYGWNDASGVARVYLGQIAMDEGNTDRAQELWQEVVDDAGDNILAAEVRLNLFRLARADGRGEEVATELEAMLVRENKPLPGDVILIELATTLEELGRDVEATERYQQLLDEYEASPYADEARRKLAGRGGQSLRNLSSFPS